MSASSLSKSYWPAVRAAILFQVLGLVLWALSLDGEGILQIWIFAMIAFWSCVALMVTRRRMNPTKVDLWFIRWGSIVLFLVAAPVLAHAVWSLRGVL